MFASLTMAACHAVGSPLNRKNPSAQEPILCFTAAQHTCKCLAPWGQGPYALIQLCVGAAHRGGPALLAKVLGVWANFLQRDADEKGQEFNGRPFYRICMGCIQELTPSSRGDSDGIAYLATIAGALLEVQPLRVPGFTFPWLELVSHRCVQDTLGRS